MWNWWCAVMEKWVFSICQRVPLQWWENCLNQDFHIWPLIGQSTFSYPTFEVIVIPDFQRFWHKQHHLSSREHVHKKRILGICQVLHNCSDYEKLAPMKLKWTSSLQLPISIFKLPVLKSLPLHLLEVLGNRNFYIFAKFLRSVKEHAIYIYRHYSCQSSLQP